MKKYFPLLAIFLLTTAGAISQKEMNELTLLPPPPKPILLKPPPPPAAPAIFDEKVKVRKKDGEIIKEPLAITIKGAKADEFYKKNPTAAEISRQGNIVTIKKKDGSVEKYDMSINEDDKKLSEKYGVSPIPPPPPPPPKPIKRNTT